MGNDESRELAGEVVQEQGNGCLWGITLAGKKSPGSQEEFEIGDGCCLFTHQPGTGTEAVYCRSGAEHLRLLRHPNILKFLHYETAASHITMVTEPVLPVLGIIPGASLECLVMGWRGLVNGLTFLHTKISLSHNNLSLLCVYVSTVNSQWKIGGFELACKHSKIDKNFVSAVEPLRYKKSIPPEDKDTSSTAPGPPHARDVWGFGHIVLASLDKANLNDKVGDSLFLYVQDNILNADPTRRPTLELIANKSWMSNEGSRVLDFLTNLTLKSQSQKEVFFKSLPQELFKLPPIFLAEHLVPLLLNPLVMAEPRARGLWHHLLTPVTEQSPRPNNFSPHAVCPLLPEAMFVDHVTPLVLNLFESREQHVRIVLLEHLICFVGACSQMELMDSVLPEVLVGLKDGRVELVQATLHALGDLVPLVGTQAILGCSNGSLFTNSKPRSVSVSASGPVPASSLPSPSNTPDTGRMRQQRQERQKRMREEREQQKLKRQMQPRLGKLIGINDKNESRAEEPVVLTQPSHEVQNQPSSEDCVSQYSPSISHDEDAGNEESEQWSTHSREEWKADNTEHEQEDFSDWDTQSHGGPDDYQKEKEWRQDTNITEQFDEPSTQDFYVKPAPKTSGMKLKANKDSTTKQVKVTKAQQQKINGSNKPLKSSSKQGSGDNFRSSMKGRLNEEDLARLEAKRMFTVKEPDFFADMEPKVKSSSSLTLTSEPSTPANVPSDNLASAMQYQPQDTDEFNWGEEEDWNEF